MKRPISIVFGLSGALAWFAPTFNGLLFEAVDISVADGRIIGSVFLVGAALLWYLPERTT